jgi:hypothetical protein
MEYGSTSNKINQLAAEGSSIDLNFSRTGDTTGTLTWTTPTNFKIYNGILIVANTVEINQSNFPTDGVKYTASNDFQVPANTISRAQVVVALYNDTTTVTAELIGLEPSDVYYFSAHMVTNVRTYFTAGVLSYPTSKKSETFAGEIDRAYGPPENPAVGTVYYDPDQNLIFVWDGAKWQTTEAHTVIADKVDPKFPFNTASNFGVNDTGVVIDSRPGINGLPFNYPTIGDFFYNTTQKQLKIWDGSQWQSAESKTGLPMYDRMGVGDDGRYEARANLVDILKKQLGYPMVCVELTEDHFNIALNNALQEIRRRADTPYYKKYFFMQMQPAQDIYYLNDPALGTDKIVDVLKIHRLNLLGLVNFAPDNIYAQQFLNQFYAPGVQYDLVSIHLIHAMSEMYSLLFAGEVAFNWRESSREMRIYRRFSTHEKVLIECTCEKPEQELLVDRWMQQWIQQWAEAELMMMLANVRGKYTTLPGPGGSMSLNASELRAEGTRLQEDCLRQMLDFEVGQNGPDNFFSPFVIG